jgi:phage terminase large subunit GpA-like protein
VLVLDEVDRMSQKKIHLALTRLDGQLQRLVWAISTPTVPEYGVHTLYLQSTQEHFFFKCPSCSRRIELLWADSVEIIGESATDPRRHESYLKCLECKAKLPHEAKPEFLAKGEWHPTVDGGDPEYRGFWLPQLYSFVKTPGKTVSEYLLGHGDEAAATEFHNSKLGLPYVGEGAQVTDDLISQQISDFTTQDPRPLRGGQDRLFTMGIDQGKICWWSVCEWFFNDYVPDLNSVAVPKLRAFGTFLETDWEFADHLMWEWQILACVVDADPDISEARRFAKRFNKEGTNCVYLCRYRRGKTAKEIGLAEEHTGAPIATVDRTNWLTATLGRFRSGRIMLPSDTTDEYKAHLKSLVRTYEKNDDGDMEVVFKKRGPDHYAHSLNYAEIGLPLAASIFSGENVEKFL